LKITGSYTLDASQEEVWAALNDIDVLARVVPGCERLDQVGENMFEGTVKIGIQAIKGAYNGKIRLEEIQPPSHYKLVANGKSANGVVDGSGTVDLATLPDGKTQLTYGGDAQIGGVLASVGQRLIEGASRQLINQSLKALAEQIVLRRAATAPVTPAVETVPIPPEPMPAAEPIAPANATPAATIAQPPVEAVVVTPPVFKSVVVPESEQLKPESVVSGMVMDIVRERPWIMWLVAAAIGFLIGRASGN
jgi:uncharacterized protein